MFLIFFYKVDVFEDIYKITKQGLSILYIIKGHMKNMYTKFGLDI